MLPVKTIEIHLMNFFNKEKKTKIQWIFPSTIWCVRFFGPLMRAKCVNVAQAQHVHQSVTVVYEQITQTFCSNYTKLLWMYRDVDRTLFSLECVAFDLDGFQARS